MIALLAVYLAAIAIQILHGLFWLMLAVSLLVAAWMLSLAIRIRNAFANRKPNGLVRHG